jgi:hypothetical protein
VQSILQELDPQGERFKIRLDDRTIDSSCVESDSLGHATAVEFRGVLGREHYASLRTFGFVRHPIDKIVSAYFFTKKGSFHDIRKIRSSKSRARLMGKRMITLVLARLLPFSLWALIYPMKKCSDYYADESGMVIVDALGSTERLSHDLVSILQGFGIRIDERRIPHLNQSRHNRSDDYISRDGLLSKWLQKKYAYDIELYEMVSKEYKDFRGEDVRLRNG